MFLFVEIFFIALLSMILLILYSGTGSSARKRLKRAVINGSWTGRERRQHVRFKNALEVNYIEKKPRQSKGLGKTVDISMGGIRLLLEEKLSKGAVLLLKIVLPDNKRSVNAEGEIVWSEEISGNSPEGKRMFHAGVRFVAVKDPSDNYLLDYIRSLPQSLEAS